LFLNGYSWIQLSVLVTVSAPPDTTLEKLVEPVWLCFSVLNSPHEFLFASVLPVTSLTALSILVVCMYVCTVYVATTLCSADMGSLNIFLWSGQTGKVVSSSACPHTPSPNKSFQPTLNSHICSAIHVLIMHFIAPSNCHSVSINQSINRFLLMQHLPDKWNALRSTFYKHFTKIRMSKAVTCSQNKVEQWLLFYLYDNDNDKTQICWLITVW